LAGARDSGLNRKGLICPVTLCRTERRRGDDDRETNATNSKPEGSPHEELTALAA